MSKALHRYSLPVTSALRQCWQHRHRAQVVEFAIVVRIAHNGRLPFTGSSLERVCRIPRQMAES
jgi:hypothetical protein